MPRPAAQDVSRATRRPRSSAPPRPDRLGVLEGGRASGSDPLGVRVFLYDADHDDRQLRLDEIHVDKLGSHELLWIDVSNLDAIQEATAGLALTHGTVARITDGHNSPELFFHESYFHVVVVAARRTPAGYEPSPLHCVVGENWILTVHGAANDVLARFDERIRGDSPLGRLSASTLLATFLEEHVAGYVRESEPFEIELDALDLQVMAGRADDAAVFKQLVELRRRVARLRRLLAPHSELFGLFARPDFAALSGSDSMEAFAHLAERINQAVQRLETTREMIVSSFEIYTTWTAHGTNRVMKLLTASSVALLPAALLASIMGMNSLPHALTQPSSFLFTMVAMACLIVTVFGLARRRRWF